MRAKTWKALIVAALAVVILTAAVGGTMAWLSTQTQDLTNTFVPAKVTCAVEEDFTEGGTEKKDVRIQNTGTTDAYIRAMIVANWCTAADTNGKTKVVAPYAVNASNFIGLPGSGWVEHDGFYYYTQPVAPDQKTGNLFASCTPGNDKPEGADHLEVNIICQAVQSTPAAAVGEAWKVTIAPNSVTAYSSTGN